MRELGVIYNSNYYSIAEHPGYVSGNALQVKKFLKEIESNKKLIKTLLKDEDDDDDDDDLDDLDDLDQVDTIEEVRKKQGQAPPEKRGNAPKGDDGHPVELHHRDQTMDGPLDEMTRTDHRGKGNYKKNHPNTGKSPSKIDRSRFKKQRNEHWKREWDNGRFDNLKKE